MSKQPHPSFARLLNYCEIEVVGMFTSGHAQVGPDFESAVRAKLGVSSGVFTNWKSRGISKEGALTAQRRIGCSANWILTGVGERRISTDPAPDTPPPAPEEGITVEQRQLLDDFDMLIPEDQHAIRKLLKEKADYARRVWEAMERRHNIPAPVTNKRVEESFGAPPSKVKTK